MLVTIIKESKRRIGEKILKKLQIKIKFVTHRYEMCITNIIKNRVVKK